MFIGVKRFLILLLPLCLSAALLQGCSEASRGFDIASVRSYKDIPGVTQKEIDAIEALKDGRAHFTYGSMPTTEAFSLPDGQPVGFTAALCELLSELFDIPFVQRIHYWDALKSGIDDKKIDFTGDLTPTVERKLVYFMTHPIAQRSLKIFTYGDSAAIETEEDVNGLRIGFAEGTITAQSILDVYHKLSFEIVNVQSTPDSVEKLRTGVIDAFVDDAVGAYAYGNYAEINSKDFFSLVYTPVSLTTANPELGPVISVFNRYIAAGGIDVLNRLYKEGNTAYSRYEFMQSLTVDERAYLQRLSESGAAVPVLFESGNYPLSFYNEKEKEYQGIVPDFLAEISALTGLRFENKASKDMNWNEVLDMLRTGEASMVSELIRNEERERDFIWPPEPYATSRYVFASKSSYPDIEMYQVETATVGFVRNTAYEALYDESFPGNTNTRRYGRNSEAIEALENGEIDLLLIADNFLLEQINYREKSGYKANITFGSPIVSYFGFNKNERILCSIISKAQFAVDAGHLESGWKNRVFDYERKLAENRVFYLTVFIAAAALMLIILAAVFLQSIRRNRLVKKQSALLSAIYDSSPDLIISKDKNYVYTSCNQAFMKLAGRAESEIIGKTTHEVFAGREDMADLFVENDAIIINGGAIARSESWYTYPDRTRRFFETVKTPIVEDGKQAGLVGISRDITGHQAALDGMHKVHERTKLMLDTLPLSCCLFNKARERLDCNDEMVRLFNLNSKQEFIDRFFELSPEYQPDGSRSDEMSSVYIDRAFKDGKCEFEWEHQKLDGTPIPVLVTIERAVFDDGEAALAYMQDLRERRRMVAEIEKMAKEQADAERIQSEHRRAKLILDEMPFACFLLDMNFEVSNINEAAVKMFGLDDDNKFIDNYWAYSPEYQPDGSLTADLAAAYLKKAFDEGKITFQWAHQLLDGTPIPTETTLVRLDLGDKPYLVSYTRDLREHNKMMAEVERHDNLLSASNRSALFLLGATDELSLDATIMKSLEAIGHYVTADRVQFWRRENLDGVPCINLLYEWTTALGGKKSSNAGANILWDEIPKEHGLFRQGGFVNGPLADFPEDIRAFLASRDIKSFLIAPLLLNDEYWGFFSLIDCAGEHLFSEDEANAMRSAGLMIMNSLLRNETERKLVAAMTEAQSANQAKSSFLANMSHEIRTPMNTIMGITEILIQSEHLNNDTEEGLNRIFNSCNLLLGIINDILDFSKIEAGKLEIISEPYDVAKLINDSVQLIKLRFASSQIEFKLQIGEYIPEVLVGDELRIRQILNNLLSNAFKYTPQGEVEFSVAAETDAGGGVYLVFVVRDTGQGMTPEQIERLFDRFTRFNMNQNYATEGAGLGMSITHGLVTMMDGGIHVESEFEKGSVFTVRLPQKLEKSSSVPSKDLVRNLCRIRAGSTAQAKKTRLARKYMPYGSVLIVDDTEANLYVAKLLMIPYGLKIDTAVSGYEAIDKIKDGNVYDIVFMDHMMPTMDGIETVKHIRALGYSAPIVALTANAVVGQSEIFLKNGFDSFISKPVDMRLLDAMLNAYIYNKQPLEILAAAQMEKETAEARTEPEIEALPAPPEDSEEDAAAVDFDVPGLNFGRGLALFDEDMETYLTALGSFCKNVPGILDTLRGVADGNISEYAVNVHGLKSISGWICADGIQARAANLETLAKAGDLFGVTTLNGELLSEAEAFITELREQLSETDA